MRATSRPAAALIALSFLRSVTVGGVVLTFLALSGAVSRATTVWLGVAVVAAAALLALGGFALARAVSRHGTRRDRV